MLLRTGGHGRGRAQRRRQPEERARHQRDDERKCEDPPVGARIERHRIVRRDEKRDQRRARPAGHRQPERRSAEREEQTLRQQLLNQPSLRRSKREPHGGLLPSGTCARQQQVRQISAGDQQNQRRQGEQKPQGLLVVDAEPGESLPCGSRVQPHRGVLLPVVAGRDVLRQGRGEHLRRDRAQVLVRLAGAPSVGEPAHHRQPVVVPARGQLAVRPGEQRFRAERNRDVVRTADLDAEESLGRDADNRERMSVDTQLAADRGAIAPERPLPERVADDCSRRTAAGPVVVRPEHTSPRRRHAQRLEEPAADEHPFGRPPLAAAGEIELARAPCGDERERLLPALDLLPLRKRQVAVARGEIPGGPVASNPDGMELDRVRGPAGLRRRTASITLKIAVLAPMPSASVSTMMPVKAGFLTTRRTAYRTSRPISSSQAPWRYVRTRSLACSMPPSSRIASRRACSGGEPPAHLLGRGDLEKRLKLVVQFLLGPPPMDQPAQDRREAMQPRHAPSNTLASCSRRYSDGNNSTRAPLGQQDESARIRDSSLGCQEEGPFQNRRGPAEAGCHLRF